MQPTLTSLAGALRALSLLATMAALGCGSPSPAPDYPTPEDPAPEDSEVEEEVEEDGDWVDPGSGDETEEPEKR